MDKTDQAAKRRWSLVLGTTLALVFASAGPTAAYQRPGRTQWVSVGAERDEQVTGNVSWYPAISADGRYVAFQSSASTLVPADTNGTYDVFVRDLETGVTERVSMGPDGEEGNGNSLQPSVSGDGRFIVFNSDASNLVPADGNEVWDAFVHDRHTGVTELVSLALGGAGGNEHSLYPSISTDGRYVVFQSDASNLVLSDTNGRTDIFVRDLESSTIERVSVGAEGAEGNNRSTSPSLSADGRFVAFYSGASNLVAGDTNANWDVFVHDRDTGATERASVTSDGAQGSGASYYPSISGDGRSVVFHSLAWNLVPGDTNEVHDVFVRDLDADTTERVSVSSAGVQGNDDSFSASLGSTRTISHDGRYVGFTSGAANLVPGDTNGPPETLTGTDVFLHDRLTRATERVSVGADGVEANSVSYAPSVSAAGSRIAFRSLASNLAPGKDNKNSDVFVRERGEPVGVGELSAVRQGERVSVSGWATLAGNVVTSAVDAADDSSAPVPGAELTGASITIRPEQEDLLVRLGVKSLPDPLVLGTVNVYGLGGTGVLYGMRFEIGGVRHEVRALWAGATTVPPTAPYFGLYRCEPACTETARLSGGIGTTGLEVLVSAPLATLGVSEGAKLSGIEAFTAAGEAAPGSVVSIDEGDLPDATVPAAQVLLGLAPAGTPQAEVAFDTEAALDEGLFSATMDAPSLEGQHEVWARACVGQVCGAAARTVAPG